MRLGDYILWASITLNVLTMVCYGIEGHWKMAAYWFAVAQLNAWLVWRR